MWIGSTIERNNEFLHEYFVWRLIHELKTNIYLKWNNTIGNWRKAFLGCFFSARWTNKFFFRNTATQFCQLIFLTSVVWRAKCQSVNNIHIPLWRQSSWFSFSGVVMSCIGAVPWGQSENWIFHIHYPRIFWTNHGVYRLMEEAEPWCSRRREPLRFWCDFVGNFNLTNQKKKLSSIIFLPENLFLIKNLFLIQFAIFKE